MADGSRGGCRRLEDLAGKDASVFALADGGGRFADAILDCLRQGEDDDD